MTQEDLIDRLIAYLEAALPEIRWDRDALDMAATEETGAVELIGEAAADWADGHPVDSCWCADVWICVSSSGAGYAATVPETLMKFDDEVSLITWSAPERHYLYDIGKVSWRWRVNFWEVLEPEEEETETDG